MFSADCSILADTRVQTKSNMAIFPNSRADNSRSSGPIRSIIELIRDLMVILIKFGADW